jgi:hypothetical protein
MTPADSPIVLIVDDARMRAAMQRLLKTAIQLSPDSAHVLRRTICREAQERTMGR